jgi:hypothetical protein
MSTVPIKTASTTPATESVADKFRRLAEVWRAETAYVSSGSDLSAHPPFRISSVWGLR